MVKALAQPFENFPIGVGLAICENQQADSEQSHRAQIRFGFSFD